MSAAQPSTAHHWPASLSLHYRQASGCSVVNHQHSGPLRVLKSLYPEGDAVCHNVLVHPPSGLVGGDTLDIQVQVDAGAHALITTPGATRFYRSEQGLAQQKVSVALAPGAKLEWLPLETIAYSGCQALNQWVGQLAPGSELMAWDMLALGLPHANLAFEQGRYAQHLEIKGMWLERADLAASDERLLNSPLGLAGQRCMGTLVLAQGSPWAEAERRLAVEVARQVCEDSPLKAWSGVTSPDPRIVVLRVLAPQVEAVFHLLKSVWMGWRADIWRMPTVQPRIWAM
jgi:urease accessory protein